MKTRSYDEREAVETFHRLAPAALAWAALVAFFAIAGAVTWDEPAQVAEPAAALRQAADTAP